MKLCYVLLLFLALLMPAQAAPADNATPAVSLDVLRLEPWEKRPLLLEYTTGGSLLPSFSATNFAWDALYRLSPDRYVGLGFGLSGLSRNQVPAFGLSGIGRYYLPADVSSWLDLPFSRFYLEARLGLNRPFGPPRDAGFGLYLNPLIGFETRFYSFSVRVGAGLNLNYFQNNLIVEPLLLGGLGLSITFEDYDTSAYALALEQLNLLPPAPAFRISYGAGVPEGLGWTAWLMVSDWGVGFFKGAGDDPLVPQVGFVLRRYAQAQRMGGMGYLEAVLSTSDVRAAGLRLGYEYRLASWLHLEASLGGGVLAAPRTTTVQPVLLGNLGLGLTLPLPLTDLPAGN